MHPRIQSLSHRDPAKGVEVILSPWSRRLNLPFPYHVHWQRSCCQSRERTAAICKKACFLGLSGCMQGRVCSVVPACGVRGCCVGARQEPGHRHGYVEAVHGVAGGRRTLVGSPLKRRRQMWSLYGRTRGRLGGVVSSRSAGSKHAWALGLVLHPVALSGGTTKMKPSPNHPSAVSFAGRHCRSAGWARDECPRRWVVSWGGCTLPGGRARSRWGKA